MSEFSWGTKVVDEAELQHPEEPAEEPETLSLSADDFSALEDRILRAVELVKRERTLRAAAEERAGAAEAQMQRQTPLLGDLDREVKQLRNERDHVRQRVEKLLSQLDALEL